MIILICNKYTKSFIHLWRCFVLLIQCIHGSFASKLIFMTYNQNKIKFIYMYTHQWFFCKDGTITVKFGETETEKWWSIFVSIFSNTFQQFFCSSNVVTWTCRFDEMFQSLMYGPVNLTFIYFFFIKAIEKLKCTIFLFPFPQCVNYLKDS